MRSDLEDPHSDTEDQHTIEEDTSGMIRDAGTMGIPPVIAWELWRRAADCYSAPGELAARDYLTEIMTDTYDNTEEHVYWEGEGAVLTLQDYAIRVVETFSLQHADGLREELRE